VSQSYYVLGQQQLTGLNGKTDTNQLHEQWIIGVFAGRIQFGAEL